MSAEAIQISDGPLTPAVVDRIETAMLALPQADCPVFHHFGPGIYVREVNLPAGVTAIGHAQRLPHLNVMLKGRVRMHREDGSTMEIAAPALFVGPPGRKIGYVVEDVVWLNVYATDETDIETLERTYLDKSPAWRADQERRGARERDAHEADRADFLAMAAEAGVTPEDIRAQSERTEDLADMPQGSWSVMVADSPIEGRGLFATAPIAAAMLICPGRVGGKRTPAGRYTNHSATPNARAVLRPNGDVDLVAVRDIAGCRGGQPGDEITLDYRQVLRLRPSLGPGGDTCQG
jgi:hypothetical protein